MLNPTLIRAYNESPSIAASVEWSRSRLSRSELEYISRFENDREIDLEPNAKLYLFHGSPRSNTEDLLATSPPEALDEMLSGATATVMAGGHTHIQMLRQHHGCLLVNPGSVGLPFKDYVSGGRPTILPHAEYAIVEATNGRIEVSLRRVDVDKSTLRKSHIQSDHPLREFLAQQYS